MVSASADIRASAKLRTISRTTEVAQKFVDTEFGSLLSASHRLARNRMGLSLSALVHRRWWFEVALHQVSG